MKRPRNFGGFISPDTRTFPGEIRVFTPEGANAFAQNLNATAVISRDYGKTMGINFSSYQTVNLKITNDDMQVARESNAIFSLKYPAQNILDNIRTGSLLVTMAHFHTRPNRVKYLNQRGISTISLDGIVDNRGKRLVENLNAVAWNSADVLFDYLEKTNPLFFRRKFFKALILGSGAVGQQATDSLIHLGNRERKKIHPIKSLVLIIGRNVVGDRIFLHKLLKETDILVDATNRNDPSVPLLMNSDLSYLKENAIILDLTADSYDPFEVKNCMQRSMVKAIEGIPTGDANKFIFSREDPKYASSIPRDIPAKVRRLTISHGSWPAIKPSESMVHYENQLIPLIRSFMEVSDNIQNAYLLLNPKSVNPLERALYRGTLRAYVEN